MQPNIVQKSFTKIKNPLNKGFIIDGGDGGIIKIYIFICFYIFYRYFSSLFMIYFMINYRPNIGQSYFVGQNVGQNNSKKSMGKMPMPTR